MGFIQKISNMFRFFSGYGDGLSFTAIDVETANSSRSSICQIGFTRVVNGKIVGSACQLIKPVPFIFALQNICIHGIREEHVERSPTFKDFYPRLCGTIRGPLFAHNASFDMSAIRNAMEEHGIPDRIFEYYCSMKLSREAFPGLETYSLQHICQIAGISTANHHDAQADSIMCAKLVLAIAPILRIRSNRDLTQYLGNRSGTSRTKSTNIKKKFSYGSFPPELKIADFIPKTDRSLMMESPIYDKTVVITGVLSSFSSRSEAWQYIVDRGGFVKDSVTKKIDILIIADIDYPRYLNGQYVSGKVSTALDYIGRGLPIKIISESDFMNTMIPV